MIAVLSDIHANLAALEAVLEAVEAAGCERIISLGDVAGYHAQPGECIDLLKAHRAVNIMGNHDYYLVSGEDCPRSRTVAEINEVQKGLVSAEQIEWLCSSVPYIVEGSDYFAHGGWQDPMDQYLYEVSAAKLPPESKNFFTGHTHVQVVMKFGEQTYCNPGSVGQPRDGDCRAAFAILDEDGIHLRRVAYDIDKTAKAMRDVGFPERYYENLYIGAQIGGRIDKVSQAVEG